jgi:hypothetical protein
LLEDLLIFQGLKLKLGTEAVRALVKVDRQRVTRVSKLIKKSDTN